MITADVYEIVAVILALAFLILIIFTIPVLLQIKKTAKSVEELSGESKKSLETLNGLMKKTGNTAGELDILVKKLKNLSTSLTGITELIGGNFKSTIATLISLIIGLQYGLKYFINNNTEKTKTGERAEEKQGGEDVKGQE